MPVLVLLDGTVLDPDVPLLSAADHGILRGDGVFETLLVVDGRPRKLGAHLDRLANSAVALRLPMPAGEQWRRCVDAACAAWAASGAPGGGEMALRLVLSRGRPGAGGSAELVPTAYAYGFGVDPVLIDQRRTGVAALILDRGYPAGIGERAPWLLVGAKTLSYAVNMAAFRYAREHGAEDVVFTSSDGWVLEGPTSSVVIANGRCLRTPPVTAGILPGTSQQALFRAAEAAGWSTKSEPLRVDDLFAADGVWLVSSVRQLARVHTMDGRPLPDPGLTGELFALLGKGVQQG